MRIMTGKPGTILRAATTGIVTLLLVMQLHAQTRSELVAEIRKDFQVINEDKKLTKKILSNEQFMENMTDGGGELTGFYKKGSVVKIVEWIGLSYGIRIREFYFKSNKLFFAYEKFQSFVINDSTNEMEHSKTTTTFEGRYYFNSDKLIEQKFAGKRIFDNEPADIRKELLAEAERNRKLLK